MGSRATSGPATLTGGPLPWPQPRRGGTSDVQRVRCPMNSCGSSWWGGWRLGAQTVSPSNWVGGGPMLGQSPVPTQAWLGTLGLQLNHPPCSQDALVGAGPRGWAGGGCCPAVGESAAGHLQPQAGGTQPTCSCPWGGGRPQVARFWGPELGLPPGPGGGRVYAGVVPGSCFRDSTLNGFDQPERR